MYKKINDSQITKWLARVLITHNFIFAVIVRTSISEYFFEGFPLIIISIWLSWFKKYIYSIILMFICLYTFYMHW